MKQDVILKFIDGKELEGSLTRPFKPSENEVAVVSVRNGKDYVFSLNELCYVMVLGKLKKVMPSEVDEFFEHVETITGQRYHVRILEQQTGKSGFFGFPVDNDTPYRSVFFTFHGVRLRSQERPLGKILVERGLVEESVLEEILSEQEALKKRRVGEIIAERNNLPQETVDKTIEEASKKPDIPKNARVGDILIAAGLVTREQVEEALASQKVGKKKKVGALLVDRGLVTEDQLLSALATKFRMRFVDLNEVTPTNEALAAVSKEMVYRMQVLPIEASSNTLVVATSSPTDPTIGDNLRFVTNSRIELVVARSKEIAAAIQKYYEGEEGPEEGVEDLIGEMSDEMVSVEEEEDAADSDFSETDSHVIRLVNKVLIDAYKKGVSDIHFEPGAGKRPFLIRYRIDGVCHVAHKVSATYKFAILSRMKIMSKLDIAERRKPQSGKILLWHEKKKIEYRVEVTPTVGGQEDAVLRILASSKPLPLGEMGFSEQNLGDIKNILAKPYGVILCVGPTGSGKTTTLHSALGYINKPDRKIWTAEDPVEITQSGLRQVQVNAKIGFTFSEALRSFLRADPDVIMIGEMRDPETAKIAIEASLTGHLVFSTLHTNSAPETVVRLVEMGMDPFNFADAMLGVLAQRLARRLCDCKESYHPSREEYDELVRAYDPELFKKDGLPEYSEDLFLMKKAGCEKCNNNGYKGRIALHELLTGTLNVKKAVKKNLSAEDLKTIAIKEGMRTLKMDGIQKVFRGDTDYSQVMRVCL